MIKIDKSKFITDFLHGRQKIDNSDFLLTFPQDYVSETLRDKNYYYSVDRSGEIAQIQKNILNFFLYEIELNNAATAFRKGFSYFNFLEAHRSGYNFLRIDISSFFHSVKVEDLKRIFKPYFADEYLDKEKKTSLLDSFLSLITYLVPDSAENLFCKGRTILPIGFITSPAVSNIIFRSIDIQIQEFCHPRNINYSRYADDMLFSSEDSLFVHSDSFYKEISVLIGQLGFKLNPKKTIRKSKSISINGYVIQNLSSSGALRYEDGASVKYKRGIWISKKKTKIIEKVIYLIKVKKLSPLDVMINICNFRVKSKFSSAPIKKELMERYARDQLFNKLSGYRSYLISVVKFNKSYNCISVVAELKYIKLIEELNSIIDKWKR